MALTLSTCRVVRTPQEINVGFIHIVLESRVVLCVRLLSKLSESVFWFVKASHKVCDFVGTLPDPVLDPHVPLVRCGSTLRISFQNTDSESFERSLFLGMFEFDHAGLH
jgi:hypothetical protein